MGFSQRMNGRTRGRLLEKELRRRRALFEKNFGRPCNPLLGSVTSVQAEVWK
jgi:hypothetical protein